MMTSAVIDWWALLGAISMLNVGLWSRAALRLESQRSEMSAEAYAARRLQLVLSAVYVLGCGYRSLFPVFDVPRLGLVDSFASSVLVGRSVATCAELCLVAQWAFMLRDMARTSDSLTGRWVSLALLPMIAVAETCSWFSVLTTSNLGHVIEESLWGLTAALSIGAVLVILPRSAPVRRLSLIGWCVAGAAYSAYMFMVDVPRYFVRYLADQTAGRPYLGVLQGLHDVATRWSVSHAWADWKSEVVWMTLYFSVGVWLSIALIHAPVRQPLAARNVERRRWLRPAASLKSALSLNPP